MKACKVLVEQALQQPQQMAPWPPALLQHVPFTSLAGQQNAGVSAPAIWQLPRAGSECGSIGDAAAGAIQSALRSLQCSTF